MENTLESLAWKQAHLQATARSRYLGAFLRAARERRHWHALARMATGLESPALALWRYLTKRGQYPVRWGFATPTGRRQVELRCPDDLVTLTEVFCREDYPIPSDAKQVVDIGGNIGLSALYFLTMAPHCHVTVVEPVPANTKRLKETLSGLESRYTLLELAVSTQPAGTAAFGVEPTGRYGGLTVPTGETIEVQTQTLEAILERVLEKSDGIDLLKIDVEGLEAQLVRSISKRLLSLIHAIHIEWPIEHAPELPGFMKRPYGSVVHYHRP